MSHITRDQALRFALDAMTDDGRTDTCVVIRAQELASAMNAAIQHYIDSAALAQPEPDMGNTITQPEPVETKAQVLASRLTNALIDLATPDGGDVSDIGAQPEPVEPKLSIFKLLAITTAYEQGVGKGKQGTEFNPYTEGTTEREAWRLGYQEGQGMAAKGGAL